MTFLNPNLLWALLAVSIPIIIHLFNFRRVKKVNFSNISLLKTVNTQAKTFLKLKQWLILASRILFIACLALAFAQPFLPSKNENNIDGRSVTSVYIDNSASMQNESNNQSALNISIKKVDRMAAEMPKSTQSQLITNDFSSTEYKNYNPTELKNEASKLETSGAVRPISEVFERQKSIAQKNSKSSRNNFFLFSDFQKSTVGNLTKLASEVENKIFLVPTTNAENSNVYVDSVWLDNPFIRKMQANGLNVRLSNSGNSTVKNMPVKLFLGDLQLNSIPTKIEANATSTIHFDFTLNQTGSIKGKVSFEDNPVSFDNEYYFVLNASPTINVIHLNNNSAQNYYLKNAFSNDSLFKYSAFPVLNVDFGLLKNADLLILEGIEFFNTNAFEAIKTFLTNGGAVFLIPSANPDLSSYSSLFGQFGIRNFQRNDIQNSELRPLKEPLKESSFYKDIFESTKIKDRLMMPNTKELLKWSTVGEAILNTRGSQNFLTYTRANKASVFVLASPLDDAFGNFAQNALFVPILYKIASLSIKSSPLAYRFEESSISFEGKSYTEKTLVKLRKDGLEMIPIQRVIGNEINIELPKANEFEASRGVLAGFYELLIDNKVEKVLAINYSNKESLMERYTPTELKNIFAKNKNIQILDQETASDFGTEYASLSQGRYIWKYFIIAALVFLAMEVLIIRFWR
ncbi:MAG: BatA domain-containing protein [Bacteroidota bacterium]